MDYYLNEYSLSGQYKDIEEFFDSIQQNTLPVLNRIEKENNAIIWKKETFWKLEVCKGIPIFNIPRKKNERTPSIIKLKSQLIKLCSEEPYWTSENETDIRINRYEFDENCRDNFETPNCFIKALETEGRIISFIHPAYNQTQLKIIVNQKNEEVQCTLDNIFNKSWWDQEPQIKTWNIEKKYTIEVRAKEYDYHPPHFHATTKNRAEAAVFKLSDGDIYTYSKEWKNNMTNDIKKWYEGHSEELNNSWKSLHGVAE